MNDLLFFLAKNVISAAILWAFYKLWMSREASLKLNRFFLLTAGLLTLVLPYAGTFLPNISALNTHSAGITTINLPVVTIGSEPLIKQVGETALFNWTLAGYFAGVVLFAIGLVISIIRLLKLIRTTQKSALLTSNVYIIEEGTPFSFMNKIFVPRNYVNHPALSSILNHEKAHIRQLHSIDTLFMEILCSIMWFNPFIYLIRNSLREVHEYLADREAIENGIDVVEYQQILLNEALSGKPNHLTNNFSFNLKNRIVMLLRKKNQSAINYRIAALPLLGVAILALCFLQPVNTLASEKNSVTVTNVLQSPDTTNNSSYTTPKSEDDQIFMVVENPPSFKGGDDARMKYLIENIIYPKDAREKGIQGTVYVTFIIEKDGTISNVKVLRGIGGGCDEESVRVIKNMPAWNPGTQRGEPQRVQYNMPIKYTLSKGKEEKTK